MDKFFKGINEETGKVEFEPELLAITKFKRIWDRDGTKDKDKALKDFTFIWCSLSTEAANPYATITDKKEKIRLLIEDIYEGGYNPVADGEMVEAISLYKERNPKNEFELQAEFIKNEIDSLRETIRSMDKMAVNHQGTLQMKPKDFAAAASEINDMVKKYDEMVTLGKEKRGSEGGTRGGGRVGMFEDINSL